MTVQSIVRAATVLSLAGLATAQVHQVAFTTDNAEPEGGRPMDAGVAASGLGVIVSSNMRLSLFSRSGGTPLDDEQVGDATFPFVKTESTFGRLFDPRVEYDPINDRLWIMYSEDNNRDPATAIGGDIARIHLAVSKEMVAPNGFDKLTDEDWHIYTGDPAPAGAAGTAIDLTLDDPVTGLKPYRGGPGHDAFTGIADFPTVAFDERALILTPWGNLSPSGPPGVNSNTVIIIPFEHGAMGADSILDGDRPAESDITIIRLSDLDLSTGGFEDLSLMYHAIQEPFEQAENATLFINVPTAGSGKQNEIRMKGLYFEGGQVSDWRLRQREVGGVLTDMPLDVSGAFSYHVSNTSQYLPDTPGTWSVGAKTGFFHSGVLAKDVSGNMRVFAAHHVFPSDGTSAEDQFVVQWYVIDPDLGNLESSSWLPTVVETGRIDGDGSGDFYHPVIGVTPQGVAYIEYTYSDSQTWPQVRRALLNSSYTGVVSTVTVQSGPPTAYTPSSGFTWADYHDMQADTEGCGFWSVHTLVHAQSSSNPPPSSTTKRDLWLFQTPANCNNANLNGDSTVNLYDMAMFNDLFATGARRVDMNTDGTTDAADAILYQDAYDAATGP